MRRVRSMTGNTDQHRLDQALDAALDRAIWALDLARAMGNVKDGHVKPWEAVAATLRARYPKR